MESPHWYAVYTKSRHEKVADTFLQSRDVKTFLPFRQVLSRWQDRKKLISLPLFPSYLFVNIRLDELASVIYSKGVLKILGTNGIPCPIPNQQAESIMRLVNSDLKFDPYPHIDTGNEVVIKRGPLEGVVGKIIVKRSSKHIVILSVDLINRAVSVEVNLEDVELA